MQLQGQNRFTRIPGPAYVSKRVIVAKMIFVKKKKKTVLQYDDIFLPCQNKQDIKRPSKI